MNLWAPQARLLDDMDAAVAAGYRLILCVLPTGGGKSLCMRERYRRKAVPTVIYTNRRMLGQQTAKGLAKEGLEFGVRAAGQRADLLQDLQVSSLMTEHSRVNKRGMWELHAANEVHIDEAHEQTGDVAKGIIQKHLAAGATIFLWTATPIDMPGMADHIIVGGTNSEMRACGAHVPCYTYGPDEPDLRHIGPVAVGEDLTESQNRKAIMRPGIFGRVFDSWERLNANGRPTLLFGPGVPESLWFAEQFYGKGVTAAHIDGERIWLNGAERPNTPAERDNLAEMSKAGDLQVVCNRFVMRAGVDWPWVEHMIFATVFGSLKSYLQAGGRGLRSSPDTGKTRVVLQDHGGGWWRHGSLNADRQWTLDLTSKEAALARTQEMLGDPQRQPKTCPKCHGIRTSGTKCPHCGFEPTIKCPKEGCGFERKGGPKCPKCGFQYEKNSRLVVQENGDLRPYHGDVYRPRVTKQEPDTEKLWKGFYYFGKNSKNGMTFEGIYHMFKKKHGYYPPKTLPYMPKDPGDWQRRVRDVPFADLQRAIEGIQTT